MAAPVSLAPAASPSTILALDLATRLGWARLDVDGCVSSGAVQLPSPPVARLAAFWRWLEVELRPAPQLLVYERIVLARMRGGIMGAAAHRVASQLEGLTLLAAGLAGVPRWTHVTPAELKVSATGKGNAPKAEVVASMRERWGRPELEDDNEADALALLALAIDALKVVA